ncbi:hypothetical protein [Allorhodopirellula solitaria]|uniref:Uncharacterized protein n=1 Tax=Allorhodopirellula solitaria TaxID=2527987 RepID=A0A5C5YG82_9BACT|nr:hypothetical protein [Allorhodopirellula solitaria]TWT73385.1 hypothetical protein CA85_18550 [Allorhodopirellula solitaria]
MRSLTIGALIVCGGTIAALPFRRDHVETVPEENSSSLITMPASELAISSDMVPDAPWFSESESSERLGTLRQRAQSAMSLASQARRPDAMRGIPSQASARPRRDVRLPLTYDDLAVPLTATHFHDGRFNALASQQAAPWQQPAQPSQAQQMSPQQLTASNQGSANSSFETMQVRANSPQQSAARRPPWEMAGDLPQSILLDSTSPATAPSTTPSTSPLTSPVAQATTAPAASQPSGPASSQPTAVVGRLASDSQMRPRDVAETPAQPRQRHWIRQPN